jgi:Ca2+:H+ antiporter
MKQNHFFKPSLDWLLIFVPIAIVLRFWPGFHNETALFIVSCLGIVPLAGWMGRATEELAEHLGEGTGGLLNATFGNAAELIISIMALSKGLVEVVKASITGSIIGNILLVLGASFFAGGLKYPTQRFNQTAARSSSTALTLAAIALLIPSVFHHASLLGPNGWSAKTAEAMALWISAVLLLIYGCILGFSLKTHKQLFAGSPVPQQTEKTSHAGWSASKSAVVLFIATVLVAVLSESLVGSIEEARTHLGLTQLFVGVIVVAIVGNAAEHSSAVMMARKNKMDLCLGIAMGSSLQIALFVAPALVFISYFFFTPMDLEFSIPEVVAVIASVHIVGQINGDGESNWLEGMQLIAVYMILGILFYFLPAAAGH